MVIKKVFSATVGSDKILSAASANETSLKSNESPSAFVETTSLIILGVLPSKTFSGKSMGVSNLSLPSKCLSVTVKCSSSVALPTTANGARSRSQIAVKSASCSSETAKT